MSRREDLDSDREDGFPRVSGDEPFCPEPSIRAERFSPRERG